MSDTGPAAARAIETIESVTRQVRAEFGGLSVEQLNRRPAAGQWSVAQCLDHLITINRLYFPVLAAIAAGTYRPSVWARVSPLSGMFGGLLVKSLRPDNPKPIKTSAKAEPSASQIPADILDRFEAHQADLVRHIRAIPASVDERRTVLTSPLVGFVTYSLADCLTMLAVHEERHLGQARRVITAVSSPTPSTPHIG